ncbi:cyclin dependent kinase 11B pitslre isoform X2 [Rhipicephalus microplus]|uniref:cyclin dependent kinase 11B pitslre isoform X2 n=1 Tax=Rhipicephalus microplus TaxID=6941 RepID=UPI003F6CF416
MSRSSNDSEEDGEIDREETRYNMVSSSVTSPAKEFAEQADDSDSYDTEDGGEDMLHIQPPQATIVIPKRDRRDRKRDRHSRKHESSHSRSKDRRPSSRDRSGGHRDSRRAAADSSSSHRSSSTRNRDTREHDNRHRQAHRTEEKVARPAEVPSRTGRNEASSSSGSGSSKEQVRAPPRDVGRNVQREVKEVSRSDLRDAREKIREAKEAREQREREQREKEEREQERLQREWRKERLLIVSQASAQRERDREQRKMEAARSTEIAKLTNRERSRSPVARSVDDRSDLPEISLTVEDERLTDIEDEEPSPPKAISHIGQGELKIALMDTHVNKEQPPQVPPQPRAVMKSSDDDDDDDDDDDEDDDDGSDGSSDSSSDDSSDSDGLGLFFRAGKTPDSNARKPSCDKKHHSRLRAILKELVKRESKNQHSRLRDSSSSDDDSEDDEKYSEDEKVDGTDVGKRGTDTDLLGNLLKKCKNFLNKFEKMKEVVQKAETVEANTANEASPLSEDGDATQLPPYLPAIQGCRSVEEFHCLNRIEEGTYGVVYRARDKKTDEIVALKRLKMEKEKEGFPITSLREINTLLKAQHPNIVTVREIVVGSNMDKIYIVMDYVEHDLKSLMEVMKQPFLVGEVKTLMLQLLKAVAHLHDNWILHRDLKTSNLLLSHKGILKVGDFGLAREYGSPLKHYTPIVVTMWYRAPELLLGVKEYSTPIDMWSVGCIFGELLTMKPLFPGKSDIDQLNRIFKDLGTPSEKIWPGYTELPLVKKVTFTEHPYNNLRSRFGHTLSNLGFDLINKFLTYYPQRRITAEDALKHEFFNETPVPVDPSMFPTWPAKSELGHRKAQSPKPPSGGKQFAKQLGEGDDEGLLAAAGFHMNIPSKGSSAKGTGFSLKF